MATQLGVHNNLFTGIFLSVLRKFLTENSKVIVQDQPCGTVGARWLLTARIPGTIPGRFDRDLFHNNTGRASG